MGVVEICIFPNAPRFYFQRCTFAIFNQLFIAVNVTAYLNSSVTDNCTLFYSYLECRTCRLCSNKKLFTLGCCRFAVRVSFLIGDKGVLKSGRAEIFVSFQKNIFNLRFKILKDAPNSFRTTTFNCFGGCKSNRVTLSPHAISYPYQCISQEINTQTLIYACQESYFLLSESISRSLRDNKLIYCRCILCNKL